jgi:hypothetical protein
MFTNECSGWADRGQNPRSAASPCPVALPRSDAQPPAHWKTFRLREPGSELFLFQSPRVPDALKRALLGRRGRSLTPPKPLDAGCQKSIPQKQRSSPGANQLPFADFVRQMPIMGIPDKDLRTIVPKLITIQIPHSNWSLTVN